MRGSRARRSSPDSERQARDMTDAPASPALLALRVHGLDCAEEVAVLKRAVGPAVGGEETPAFDVLRGKMTVLATAPPVALEDLRQAVARTGMWAESWQEARAVESFWQRRGRTLSVLASGLFLALGFVV